MGEKRHVNDADINIVLDLENSELTNTKIMPLYCAITKEALCDVESWIKWMKLPQSDWSYF